MVVFNKLETATITSGMIALTFTVCNGKQRRTGSAGICKEGVYIIAKRKKLSP